MACCESGGGCSGSCYSYCTANCSNGCSGDCDGTCSGGCDGCDGCSGCGGACSSSCSGDCDGGCSGCGGACSSNCTGCTGTCNTTCTACTGNCTGACDNGCTASNAENDYNNVGKNIKLGHIMYASEFNEVGAFIDKEMQRRSKTPVTVDVVAGEKIKLDSQNELLTSLQQMGKTGQTSETGEATSSAKMQDIIAKTKELYNQILKP